MFTNMSYDFISELFSIRERPFGDILKYYRKKNCLTLKQLSEKSGLAKSYLSMMENGKRKPGSKTSRKLALALEIPTYAMGTFIDRAVTMSFREPIQYPSEPFQPLKEEFGNNYYQHTAHEDI